MFNKVFKITRPYYENGLAQVSVLYVIFTVKNTKRKQEIVNRNLFIKTNIEPNGRRFRNENKVQSISNET